MALSISISISIPTAQLSFSKTLTSQNPLFLSKLSLHSPLVTRKTTIIRMGGGPRTYPGGVSKWQWKRMQAKKAKQLLKARLCRERQIYEMRKRAELKAAVSELERPWEVVERVPNLFSVKADEQVKVLADRFQKPGGFDFWSKDDGPQLFQSPIDGLPSARFFPKGVVHSVKPYGLLNGDAGEVGFDDDEEVDNKDAFFSDEKNGDDVGFSGLEDGLYLDSEDDDHFDGNLGMDRNIRRRNGGEMKKNRGNGFRSGLGSLELREEKEDVPLMQNSKFGTKRSSSNKGRFRHNGGLRNSRYPESGDGSSIQHGETKMNSRRNDGRIRRNGGGRNSRYSDSRDGASKQPGETRNNRSRNDGRFRQSAGLRNSRFYKSRDGALMQDDGSNTNWGRNNGRFSRNGGGLRNSRYSSESEVFDMSLQQDGSYGFPSGNRRYMS